MSKEIIQFDQAMFETKLDTMVREKVERIVNAMLDAEADEIANAARYERTGERKAYRAGHYERKLTAKGQTRFEGAQAQRRGLRIRRHRTLPAA